jgi:hypothetical protein
MDPAKLMDPRDLAAQPEVIPRARGVYAWYFDEDLGLPERNDYHEVDGWRLLYVGIAGGNKENSLRRRILSWPAPVLCTSRYESLG